MSGDLLDWVVSNPEISVVAIGIVATLIVRSLLYVFGHKMYWLTCWNRFRRHTKWWHRVNLHDWQPECDQTLQCTRCHGRYDESTDSYFYW